MGKRAKKRIRELEFALVQAAHHIDSAADVIETFDPDDLDSENAEAREYAQTLIRFAEGGRAPRD